MFIKFDFPNGDTRMVSDCTGDVTVFKATVKEITNDYDDKDCDYSDIILEDKQGGLTRLEGVEIKKSSMSDLCDDDPSVWIREDIKELKSVLVVVFEREDFENEMTAILPTDSTVQVFNETGAGLLDYSSGF